MAEHCITQVLSHGMTVRLIESPGLSAASACLSTGAGSFDEPDRWPGLAHLLEHLLFQCGQEFQGDQRLMPWISARQGRVNATTGLCQTLYYFDCVTDDLEGGLARLLDMVSSPLFSTETAEREIGVIDAEYRLLSQQARTLITASFHDLVISPAVYRRFIVGNRHSLSGDLPALLQALNDFFRQHYRADKLTLTIRAPLSHAVMQQMLQRLLPLAVAEPPGSSDSAVTTVRLPVLSRTDCPAQLLQLSGGVHHCLAVVVADPDGELLTAVPLLRAFIEDAAPGSLRYHWTKQGLCREMSLELVSAAAGSLWLMVHLIRPASLPLPAGLLTAAWQRWLQQLTELSAERVAHYRQLAQRQFCLLSPMEQIRRIVSGQAVSEQPVRALALALLSQVPNELQTCEQLNSVPRSVCGFPCVTELQTNASESGRLADSDFIFYPQTPAAPVTAVLNTRQSPHGWQYLRAPGPQIQIVMRPAQGTVLTPAQTAQLEQALQPVFSLVRHAGGEAAVITLHGVCWLTVSLADATEAETVCCWLAKLWPTAFSATGTDPQQILIRRLLSEFPAMLASTAEYPDWSGVIQCSDQQLFLRLNDILQQSLPVTTLAETSPLTVSTGRCQHQPDTQGDNGLLFFLPLPGGAEGDIVAAKALAALYQPAFYHWLREERSVGYVVSCQYQQFANIPGILCALQSPKYDCHQLSLWCQQFFSRMNSALATLKKAPQVNVPTPLHSEPLILQAMEQLCPEIRSTAQPEQPEIPALTRLLELHNYWMANTGQAIQLSCGLLPQE